MKKYILIIILAIFYISGNSQNLINKYKTGTVILTSDKEYAQGNNWNNIFRSYYDTIHGKSMAMRKSMVMLPDGSIVVNHPYQDYHTKFSPSGNYQNEFLIEDAGHKIIKGVINNNTLFTNLDIMGVMTCSDLEGNFKKNLTLDYSAKDIIALANGKFAVVGWVLWSEKMRTFVSIVDYNTNEEKIIWDHLTDRTYSNSGKKINKRQPFRYTTKLETRGMISYTTMPFTNYTGDTPIITSVDNELIVAIPSTGEILVYNLDGKLKSTTKVDWPSNTISIHEQKEIQQKAINRYNEFIADDKSSNPENTNAYTQLVSKMEKDLQNISEPLVVPFFSTIIKDSDGNVLIFEIPKEKDANLFHVWVYNKGGNFEAECTFVCDEYDLVISPSKMIFHNGYIYGLQSLKNTDDNPLRLVRFNLTISD